MKRGPLREMDGNVNLDNVARPKVEDGAFTLYSPQDILGRPSAI